MNIEHRINKVFNDQILWNYRTQPYRLRNMIYYFALFIQTQVIQDVLDLFGDYIESQMLTYADETDEQLTQDGKELKIQLIRFRDKYLKD